MALARDYVKDQLQQGLRGSRDLISVVVMKEDEEVVIQCEPTSWVLYNKLIDFREWTNLRPSGHGFYNPAIERRMSCCHPIQMLTVLCRCYSSAMGSLRNPLPTVIL